MLSRNIPSMMFQYGIYNVQSVFCMVAFSGGERLTYAFSGLQGHFQLWNSRSVRDDLRLKGFPFNAKALLLLRKAPCANLSGFLLVSFDMRFWIILLFICSYSPSARYKPCFMDIKLEGSREVQNT